MTMIQAASSDFICNSANYDYCYTNANTCDAYWAKMSSLTFTLDANQYTIPPQAYTLSNGDLQGHLCSVAVSYSPDSLGLYILGDVFLRQFVSTYDYKNKKIKFAINTNALTGVSAVAGSTIVTTENILFVAGGAIVLFLLLYCCCKKSDKKK